MKPYNERLADAIAINELAKQRLKSGYMPEGQKFKIGDRVRIAKNLGKSMAHFRGRGCNATVVGSYAQQFGGNDVKAYTLKIDDAGESSWYYEHQLTLIE